MPRPHMYRATIYMNITSLASMIVGMQTLRANPLRTILSTLGIIIGVASLVAILALGDGVERFAREQIETTTDLQTIVVTSRTTEQVDGLSIRRADFPVLTAADIQELDTLVSGLAKPILSVGGSAVVRLPSKDVEHAALVTASTAPDTSQSLPFEIAAGGLFDDDAVRTNASVIVVSHELASALAGPDEPTSLLGERVTVRGREMEIVGVLAGTESRQLATAYIPLGSAEELLFAGTTPRPPTLIVRANQIEDVDAAREITEAWLTARFGSVDDFTVQTSTRRLEQAMQGVLVMKLVMGAITGISILVGGIGVMNVLLASVIERTKEIGIRKATGARKVDILVQFLAESVAISGVGSALGVLLGLVGAFTITAVIRNMSDAPIQAAFTWGTVAVAGVAAIVVGIVFGTYPASRAARLPPIQAMRYE